MDEVFQFARRLQADGHFGEAEKCYRRLLEDNPDSIQFLNNLGTVLESQDKLVEAVSVLMKARDLDPGRAQVRYNLGHALHRQERLASAADQYQEAARIDPKMCDARLNLAVIRWQSGDFAAAEAALRENLQVDPGHWISHSRLGLLLFELGRTEEAFECHAAVVSARPDDPEEHFMAGRALTTMGRNGEAADAFARSIAYAPANRNAHEHRLRALQAAGRVDDLDKAFDEWLDARPDDPVALHMRAAITGAASPVRASDAYVRESFDGFAEDFDETLSRLDYRGPQLLKTAVEATIGLATGTLNVLDAGCGTGLCGAWLRDYAERLTGVDLSPGMLAKANQTGCYDRLIEAELTEYLGSLDHDIDVIVAADTVIYFGDLVPLLTAAAGALVPGGLLVFTIEDGGQLTTGDFSLQPHGRYAHSKSYVCNSLAGAGLTCLAANSRTVRTEGGKQVMAQVFVARRPVTTRD